MAKLEFLNTELHKSLRVSTKYKKGLGYDVGAVMVLPCEFLEVQRDLPILFRKHSDTGRMFPNALLGFEPNENLLLSDDGEWQGHYTPLAFAKGPFVISPETNPETNETKPIISVDLDDPRISDSDAEPIFEENGELSASMDKMRDNLIVMHEGIGDIQHMTDALMEAELIEPLKLEITLKNGKEINFEGAYTIAEDKLRALDGEKAANLNKTGYLAAAYYIAGSINNIRNLINLKNNQI